MARSASRISIGSRFATFSSFNLTSGPLQELFRHGHKLVCVSDHLLRLLPRDACGTLCPVICNAPQIEGSLQELVKLAVGVALMHKDLVELADKARVLLKPSTLGDVHRGSRIEHSVVGSVDGCLRRALCRQEISVLQGQASFLQVGPNFLDHSQEPSLPN